MVKKVRRVGLEEVLAKALNRENPKELKKQIISASLKFIELSEHLSSSKKDIKKVFRLYKEIFGSITNFHNFLQSLGGPEFLGITTMTSWDAIEHELQSPDTAKIFEEMAEKHKTIIEFDHGAVLTKYTGIDEYRKHAHENTFDTIYEANAYLATLGYMKKSHTSNPEDGETFTFEDTKHDTIIKINLKPLNPGDGSVQTWSIVGDKELEKKKKEKKEKLEKEKPAQKDESKEKMEKTQEINNKVEQIFSQSPEAKAGFTKTDAEFNKELDKGLKQIIKALPGARPTLEAISDKLSEATAVNADELVSSVIETCKYSGCDNNESILLGLSALVAFL